MKRSFLVILLLIIIIVQLIIFRTMQKIEKKTCVLPDRFIYEITEPDYDAQIFANRRDALMEKLSDGIIIISASVGADFRYLTGFDERNGVAVLIPGSEKPFRMFVEPYNLYAAQWTGELHGLEGAVEKFGADKAYAIYALNTKLSEMLKNAPRLYLHTNDPTIHAQINEIFSNKGRKPVIKPIEPVVHEMRVIKDEWEIAQIQQAVNVTALAHKRVWETVAPGQKEYEVQAEVEYVYKKNGLGIGFSSIVGSGPNATVLHHVRNDREIRENELLLVDIGASSRAGYRADITRTIPVNGKFTKEQKDIYELVLKAFDIGVEELKPGRKLMDASHLAIEVLVDGLYDLGLITDKSKWWQKRFYIQHRTSHYVGLNVHDVGSYGDFDIDNRDEHILSPEFRGRELLPGMVLSMEPGLYFMKNNLDNLYELFGHIASEEEIDEFANAVRPIYEKYEGIGVRIEDVVLITKEGNKILSDQLPKKLSEIEGFFN